MPGKLGLWGIFLLCGAGCGPGTSGETAPGPADTGLASAQKAAPPQWYSERKELYDGIPVVVRFSPPDKALAAKVWAHLEKVDEVFNDYREDSEVGRLNRAGERQGREISPALAQAFRLSLELYRETGGAFDVSIRPLLALWKAAAKKGQRPAAAQIAAAQNACGLNQVKLEGTRLSVASPRMEFDFGGIAKGIAVDEAVALLRQAGVRSALVQVGGETAAFGVSPRGQPHLIGIQHPTELARLYTAIADPGTGISVSTSGNYRRPIIIEGQPYYHIINPQTGEPADTRVLSVSVAFRETGKNWLADGLSTAGAVLGPQKTLSLLTKCGGEALLLVAEEGQVREYKTAGWERLVPPQW